MTLFRIPQQASGCAVSALAVLASLLIGGCAEEQTGPKRYTVSGTVTYDGKPVPTGFITFSPDASQGNRGPGSGAPIENGRYETPEGKGVIGGKYVVSILGSDGVATSEEGEEVPGGKQLFPKYEVKIDIPKEDSDSLDFTVPKAEKSK